MVLIKSKVDVKTTNHVKEIFFFQKFTIVKSKHCREDWFFVGLYSPNTKYAHNHVQSVGAILPLLCM